MFFYSGAGAQVNLLPSIGLIAQPNDNDAVCYIPWYLGNFYSSGLQAGDTAYDFTLYNLNGDSLNLAEALSHGRPVLLVAGSYTCPVFRNKVAVINNVIAQYAGLLDVYIIYAVEAHPEIDTSVYFGYVNTTTQNIQAGILYQQPDTYGERKNVVSDMLSNLNINAPVFIDGPCNNWWSAYGPAPNNAYLIDTNGIVMAKHGWFHNYPDNIYCDIDSLLGIASGLCVQPGGNSSYTFQLNSNDTVYGEAGVTLSIDAEVHNTGVNDILIHAQKIENDMPAGWASSMCIDVCYSSATDSVVFLLAAGATQAVHVYFYTSSDTAAVGHVKLGLKNLSNTANHNSLDVYGVTSPNGIYLTENSSASFSIVPNPSAGEIQLVFSEPDNFEIEIFNTLGEKVLSATNKKRLDLSTFSAGIYFIRLIGGQKTVTQHLIIQRH